MWSLFLVKLYTEALELNQNQILARDFSAMELS